MRREVRAFVIGALVLPLSALPFGVYATQTPEGRLILDRATATLAPPDLPAMDRADRRRIHAGAPRYDHGVAVLVYHGIGSGVSGEGELRVSPERFGEHLAAMREAGLEPVTMQEVASAWEHDEPLPDNAVAVTFDDGRTDAMLFADPLLDKADWRATMYVITGRAEGRTSPYHVDWERLVEHQRSGRWDLQSHTRDLHRPLDVGGDELPALTALDDGGDDGEPETLRDYRARVRRDLSAASQAIADRTGSAPKTFAYPFGAYGGDRTNHQAIPRILREEVGRLHVLAVQQDGQDEPRLATRCDDPLQLRRIEVGDWTGVQLVHRIAEAAEATDRCEVDGVDARARDAAGHGPGARRSP